MSKTSNINSLAALRERREEIATEQEAARQGLTSTLAEAPAKAKDYALEDLALPALGIGLAIYVGYRVLRPRQLPDYEEVEMAAQQAPVNQRRSVAAPARTSLFSLSTLMTAGKILVPAAQAIIGVIQDSKETAK